MATHERETGVSPYCKQTGGEKGYLCILCAVRSLSANGQGPGLNA